MLEGACLSRPPLARFKLLETRLHVLETSGFSSSVMRLGETDVRMNVSGSHL